MTGSDATIGGDLTPREREVLAMVAAGLTNREIGEALFISESTAGVHVSHLMAKLGVASRTEAAAWAYRAGLVEAAPGTTSVDGPFGDSAPSRAPEPPSGWFGRLRTRLRQRDGRVAALSIAGVVVLGAIAAALAIAVLNGRQPAVGDLSSAKASPSLSASASPSPESSAELSATATVEPSATPSIKASPTAQPPTPTQIPLPNGTWTVTGPISTNRNGATATLLRDGTVLVAGGAVMLGGFETLSSAELYDPDSGEWTTTQDMGERRGGHSGTLLDDGTVLVAGGSFNHLATAELFDPKTGTWHATSPMNAVHWGHTATLLHDGTVLIAGGMSGDIGGEPSTIGNIVALAEIYDPRTATWTSVAPMTDGRERHTATLLEDGTVLVAGGVRTNGTSVAVAALYRPDTRTWSAAGRMVTGRNGHIATLLEDGTVLVASGGSDLGPPLASAEVYHPSTMSWTAVGSMAEPRGGGATATLLRDWTVLVAGGYGTRWLATAEVYSPSNGQWAATASMPQGRLGQSATLLANGDVLVEGGEANGGSALVTFIYHPDGGP